MGISASRVYCKTKWELDAVEIGARQVFRTTGGAPHVRDVNVAGLSCEGTAAWALSCLHTVS